MIPSAGHLFYVSDVASPELLDADHHHAVRVLRLRVGEVLTVSDGAGRWRRCRWDGATVVPDGDIVVEPAEPNPLCVAFAVVKAAKPEFVVQKLTELGIDRIVPLHTSRSVVKHDPARAGRLHDRLVAVARGASMQSRRTWLPTVSPTVTFDQLVDDTPGLVLAERGGRDIGPADRCVAVGPEGGWDDQERTRVADHVSLAEGVLRAETAAIAAGVLLGFRRTSARPGGG